MVLQLKLVLLDLMSVRILPSLEQLFEGLVSGSAVQWPEKQLRIVLLETSNSLEAEPRYVTICDPHNFSFNSSSSNILDNPLGKLIEALLGLSDFIGDVEPAIIQCSSIGGEHPIVQSLPSLVDMWVVLVTIQTTCSHQTYIICMLFSLGGPYQPKLDFGYVLEFSRICIPQLNSLTQFQKRNFWVQKMGGSRQKYSECGPFFVFGMF